MSYTKYTQPIEQGGIYHIFNHGVGRDLLFQKNHDFSRFLDDVTRRLDGHAHIDAYSFLPDHFHFMLKVISDNKVFSKIYGDACNAYAKWYNTKYHRMGTLFIKPFKRRLLVTKDDFTWIPWYIHRNPWHHQLDDDWETYPWSSFIHYTNNTGTFINKDFLISIYGGLKSILLHHQQHATAYKFDQDE